MINKTLILLHIPKTGGRSLQNIILRHYRNDEVITDGHEKLNEIKCWSDDARRKIRYIQGHFIYGVHELFPQDTAYITMLRHPVERVISHYYYLKRSPSHPLNRVLEENDIDLEKYITSGICDEVRNDQTRLVAGITRGEKIDANAMLQIAKDNLKQKFVLAGLVERFDESLLILKAELGLRNIFYGVRNQTIGRPLREQIPSETLELITESNRLDMELYTYAEQLLAEKIRTCGRSFEKNVKRFQLFNKPYSQAFYGVRKLKHILSRNLRN